MSSQLQVLMIDDSESDALLITRLLRQEWNQVDLCRVETKTSMEKALQKGSWDVVLSDQVMPAFDALGALKTLHQSGIDLPFIVTSGVINMEKVVSMSLLKLGAHDFVAKDDTARLIPTILRGIHEAEVRSEKRVALKALEESEKRFRNLFDSAPIAYFCIGLDDRINDCNLSAGNLMGCSVADLVGRSMIELYADTPHGKILARKTIDRLRHEKPVCNEEMQMQQHEGTPPFWTSLTINSSQDESSKIIESHLMITDISRHKQAEDVIKQSLSEKEILIKEIHHRVKNNLQTICSFLSLQESGEVNARAIEVLRNAKRRVYAIARTHDHIHHAANLNSIVAKDYLNDIAEDAFVAGEEKISFNLDVDDIFLEVNQAIPCGQIVSELLSNCSKHAFSDHQAGNINISLHRQVGGQLVLIVADDGVGLPEQFNIEKISSLGLSIVRILTTQLNGTLKINSVNGTRIKIVF